MKKIECRAVVLSTVVVVALIALNCSSALARKWTSQNGQVISAKFVRIHKGEVMLLRGGRVVSIPFEDFSNTDQEYIRKKLEKEGKGHLLPPAETKQGIGEPRTWTDVLRRTIQASLVRVENDRVVLLKDNKEVTVLLTHLSPADKDYVKEWQTGLPPKQSNTAKNKGPRDSVSGGIDKHLGSIDVAPGRNNVPANNNIPTKDELHQLLKNATDNQRRKVEEQSRRQQEIHKNFLAKSQREEERRERQIDSATEQMQACSPPVGQSCSNAQTQGIKIKGQASKGKKTGISYTACLDIIIGAIGFIVCSFFLAKRLL